MTFQNIVESYINLFKAKHGMPNIYGNRTRAMRALNNRFVTLLVLRGYLASEAEAILKDAREVATLDIMCDA